MSGLLEARATTRWFGGFCAVDHVDLQVDPGEVVGLLGANGAGKTTLLRMLLGLMAPSAGEVLLFGGPPSMAGRRRVGYVPQTLGLYADLTVEENWDFTTAAFDRVRPGLPEHLIAVRGQLVGTLPLGVQRQVAFAVAFSHSPELLVLDEPTSGVGVAAAVLLWEQIRERAASGVGILVTTHNMEEAEQCDRLVVLAEGRVVATGSIDEIIAGHQVTVLRCDAWREAFGVLDGAGLMVEVRQGVLRVAAPTDAVEALMATAGIRGDTTAVTADLEEAFVELVRSPSEV